MISIVLIVLFVLLALAALVWIVWSGRNLAQAHRSGTTTMVSARRSLWIEVAAAGLLGILAALGIKWALAQRARLQTNGRR